jgi:hypothetical protein
VDVSSLLESLNSGPCIFRTKDWWTYEVRPFLFYTYKNDVTGTYLCDDQSKRIALQLKSYHTGYAQISIKCATLLFM